MFNWKEVKDMTATLTFCFSCVKFGVERSLRLQKRHCQSLNKWIRAVSKFIALIPHLFQFVKCWQVFLELNPKRLWRRSSEKAKQIPCLLFASSRKREMRHFYVVVVQWRQRNVKKSVTHVQSCYFANLNVLLFWRFWVRLIFSNRI